MRAAVSNRHIAAALIKRGLLPDGCRLIDIQIGLGGAAVIRYEKLVSAGELGQVAEALADVAKELA